MLTFEEAQEALTEFADRLPPEIYDGLGGGMILSPDTVPHPQGRGSDLYILGEYHNDPLGLGRYIVLYYGSFCRVHGHSSREVWLRELERVLHHELVHHLESLAGDCSLEIQDARDMADYLQNR